MTTTDNTHNQTNTVPIGTIAPTVPAPTVCPGCGRCNTCGRSGGYGYPYWSVQPPYWHQPYVTCGVSATPTVSPSGPVSSMTYNTGAVAPNLFGFTHGDTTT